ncbi:MAG: Holliday junction branch migration protein RuvA [Anaerolineae bacterium]|jgi:Holliday junction DNA helicase RuvA|nr:Holliday junction branch migration protein RuvA [Anaerolineae bacterium]
MIDIVTGQVAAVGKNYLVILIGGVGLRIHVPTTVLDVVDGPGHTHTLYTYLAVREDSLTLYGFVDQEERNLFETLLSVSGVGPRLALAVLSTLSVEHLHNAVAREEPEILTRVPGIGKKLAHKLAFELKDRLAVEPFTGLAAISDVDTDVIATLTALGYSIVEAQAALQSIPRDAPDDIEERVRLALLYFT